MNPLNGHPLCDRYRTICIAVCWGMMVALTGCDQPIDETLPMELSAARFELGTADELRHNWPIRDNDLTVAKPPPLAFLTSFDKLISVAPLEPPDPSVWQNDALADSVKPIIRNLFEPVPQHVEWTGQINASEYAGPQAFDLSMDGKRIVTVKGNSITLYETETGKRIGKRSFEGDWSTDQPTAIRFAPETKDFLIASPKKVCRFSSKDGSMVGMIEGPGETIKKWIIADDESFMVLLTESGKLYSGDADLDRLEPMVFPDADANVRFDDFGMSFDGVRVSVMVDDLPRTYLQEGGRIVDFISYQEVAMEGPVTINCGLRDDLWVSEDSIFSTKAVTGPDSNSEFDADANPQQKIAAAPQRSVDNVDFLWKPAFQNLVRSPPGKIGEWCVAISRRPLEGKWQWVIHDINPSVRLNSIPVAIDIVPLRMTTGRWASHLAIAEEHSIRMATWVPWRQQSLGGQEDDFLALFNGGRFQEVEQVFATLGESDRWARIGCSHDVLRELIHASAQRWVGLVESQRKQGDPFPQSSRETLDRITDWFQEGSFWAKTVHAHGLYLQSWRAREGRDGLDNRSNRYSELREKALAEMKLLVESEHPIAMTMSVYAECRMESEEPQELDALCRKFVGLFPRSTVMSDVMAFKLLPQWHGEMGDSFSFYNWHARMFEPPFSGLVYLRNITRSVNVLSAMPNSWNQLDVRMLNQGIDEHIRLGMRADELINCITLYNHLHIEEKYVSAMRHYYLAYTAVLPNDYPLFDQSRLSQQRSFFDQILSETRDP